MKEDLKTIFYMGLGAISMTNDKAKEMKNELYEKGKELYDKGVIANEELKHNIHEAMKENVTVVNVETSNTTKETIIKNIEKLNDKERKELIKELNKKGWNDNNGKGANTNK